MKTAWRSVRISSISSTARRGRDDRATGKGAVMPEVPKTRTYRWDADGERHELNLVWVPGTDGETYLFGRQPTRKPIHVAGFFLATTPVTQALWAHVMGQNPSVRRAPRCPVENVSFADITGHSGFL